ncbi:MAG: hypothetical protein Q9M12_06525 [Mariprofundus sp.]|nr:hypothetical protein [Mariprofundus sp.]
MDEVTKNPSMAVPLRDSAIVQPNITECSGSAYIVPDFNMMLTGFPAYE